MAVKDRFVRLRACAVIEAILAALPPDAELADELLVQLTSALMPRTMDKIAGVRIAAARALARLQEPLSADGAGAGAGPTGDDCAVRRQLLWMARHDSSADVRVAALQAVLLRHHAAIELAAAAARDASSDVRAAAFTKVAVQVPFSAIPAAAARSIIALGAADGSPTARGQAALMAATWLVSLDGDWQTLIEKLGCDGAAPTLRTLFDAAALAPAAITSIAKATTKLLPTAASLAGLAGSGAKKTALMSGDDEVSGRALTASSSPQPPCVHTA